MNQSAVENITLDSGVASIKPESVDSKNITLKFAQKSKIRSLQRLFTIFDNNTLVVREIDNTSKKKFTIKLSMLDSTPKKLLQISFQYLYLSLLLIGCAAALHALDYYKIELIPTRYIFTAYSLLDTVAVISIIWFIYKSKYQWVFRTEYGNIQIVELLPNNPNKKSYKKFLQILQDLITKAKIDRKISKDKLLPAVLGEHRRLRDEGIISSKDYELAKNNIFKNHKK